MFTDCQGIPYSVFAQGKVSYCAAVKGAVPENSVYELRVVLDKGSPDPAVG